MDIKVVTLFQFEKLKKKKAANLLRNDYFFVYQPINITFEGKL